MPKERKDGAKAGSNHLRHAPLDRQIKETAIKSEGKFSKINPRKEAAERADDDDGLSMKAEVLDAKTTKKLLRQAQEQREEEEAMAGARKGGKAAVAGGGGKRDGIGANMLAMRGADEDGESGGEGGGGSMRKQGSGGSDSGDEEEEEYDEEYEVGSDGYVDIADMAGVSDADQAAMESFFGGTTERRTINDLILDKIREKEEEAARARAAGGDGGASSGGGARLPEKVVSVYTEIGKMLKHYSAGKLPKAFKIIPSLTNWEEVLWLTKPDEWSPASVYAATRIFASNLNERMSQRFFNLILLGRVQNDIEKHGRLNFHLFASLRKSVYKPAAFYKGIVLPLAASGQCSLKEATVIAAVLSKVSIPVNHSAVCILKLSQMPYSGPTSLFMRVLLNKKYALPHKVVDSLVEHFLSFEDSKVALPVLWHQCLLVFAQR